MQTFSEAVCLFSPPLLYMYIYTYIYIIYILYGGFLKSRGSPKSSLSYIIRSIINHPAGFSIYGVPPMAGEASDCGAGSQREEVAREAMEFLMEILPLGDHIY